MFSLKMILHYKVRLHNGGVLLQVLVSDGIQSRAAGLSDTKSNLKD